MKSLRKILLAALLVGLGAFVYWKFAIPSHRITIRSELIMLGDLDGDHHWTAKDEAVFDAFIVEPSHYSDALVCRLDLNQNGLIDVEDQALLHSLAAAGGDPYVAEETAQASGERFPRPREFYRYRTVDEFRTRPLWSLPYEHSKDSALAWLSELHPSSKLLNYEDELDAAIYSEAVRFDQAWRKRESGLLPIERDYAVMKISRATKLYQAGEKFELLLALTELVEDAETLTARNQPEIAIKLLTFRDHLRGILASPLYADFQAGRQDWKAVLKVV